MMHFEPTPGMAIQIGEDWYAFEPHPLLPAEYGEVFVVEGGEALTYRVRSGRSGEPFALKVAKPAYRDEQIARATRALAPYADLPGLTLARRTCLTRAEQPALLAAFPGLEYAVLMPWVAGITWSGFVLERPAAGGYTAHHARGLALGTAQALWNVEAHHLAHTDVAGGNVVIAWEGGAGIAAPGADTNARPRVELLDLEGLYMPHAPMPARRSQGSPGYQHRALGPDGQWRPDGDRFAGAILLGEMLSWWDPAVRALTPEGAESLFRPEELQEVGAPRWSAMRDAIWAACPATLALFDAAWDSPTTAECPELGAWALALLG